MFNPSAKVAITPSLNASHPALAHLDLPVGRGLFEN